MFERESSPDEQRIILYTRFGSVYDFIWNIAATCVYINFDYAKSANNGKEKKKHEFQKKNNVNFFLKEKLYVDKLNIITKAKRKLCFFEFFHVIKSYNC